MKPVTLSVAQLNKLSRNAIQSLIEVGVDIDKELGTAPLIREAEKQRREQKAKEDRDLKEYIRTAGGSPEGRPFPRYVAYNNCYGGFSLSEAALLFMWLKGIRHSEFCTPFEKYYVDGAGSMKSLFEKHGGFDAAVLKAKQRSAQVIEILKNREYDGLKKLKPIGMFDATLAKEGDAWFVLHQYSGDYFRDHPYLIEAIQELGDAANGQCAELAIIKVEGPYHIHEYDGNESVRMGSAPESY